MALSPASPQAQDNEPFRRKYPRRAFPRGLGVLHAGRFAMSEGDEIGEGGLSFLLPEALPLESDVVVNFRIPSGDFVSLRANVKSVRPSSKQGLFIHGVAFTNIAFTHKRQIRNFVSERNER